MVDVGFHRRVQQRPPVASVRFSTVVLITALELGGGRCKLSSSAGTGLMGALADPRPMITHG